MKTLTLRPMRALEALGAILPIGLFAVATALGTFASSRPEGWIVVVCIVALATGIASVLVLSPGNVLVFYFAFLMFEGALKILSNYNPIIRLSSDLLLGFAFLRLLGRHHRETNPSLIPEVRRRFGSLVGFFLLFWLWVAVQFLNPWGLGLLPSLAGLKIYLIPLLVFFAVGIYMRDEELRQIPFLLLALGLFQGAVSLVDWIEGPFGLPMLHPKYAQVLWEFLKGFPYRPFGTTNLPGAPALWMFHCLVGGLLAMDQLKDQRGKKATAWRITFGAFVLFGFGTLIACQVRMSLLRFLALFLGGLFLLGKKRALLAGLIAAFAFFSVLSLSGESNYEDALAKRSFVKLEDRIALALSRLNTLKDEQSWKAARGGDWVLNEFATRAEKTSSGIGLSRIGAASAPWVERIQEDLYFNAAWGFADNLPLALFTELGLGGLVGYVLLILSVLFALARTGTIAARITAYACGLMFLAGWGSEGILFQPDASLFWLAAAYGLRSPREGKTL